MKRIVCLSDTHNKLREINVPAGDIVVHAGDMTGRGYLKELRRFAEAFAELPHRHKVCIAGNHDWCLDVDRSEAEGILAKAGIVYLRDSEATVDGFRVYGAPWQPRFFDWAFNVNRGPELAAIWKKVPAGIDVLVTHGPPHGTLDLTMDGQRVGCEDLTDALQRIRPRVHCFGHIHHSYGVVELDGTIYVNASNLDERYSYANDPIVVELEPRGSPYES